MKDGQLVIRSAVESDMPSVRALWRKNSSTLGFFPDGAFQEALLENRIILAEYQEQFAGYLLYRYGRGRATIVHFVCVEQMRGKGITQALNAELLKRTRKQGCAGVGLSCRRDYNLSSFWSHLGYVPLSERTGRGTTGHALTFWWHDHHQPDLFSSCHPASDRRLTVVIDTSVLLRLHGQDIHNSDIAKSLEADWLSDLIEICVTPEHLVEIDRAADKSRRYVTRKWIRKHRMLDPDYNALEKAKAELNEIIPAESLVSENDRSDFNHAAYALAAEAEALVTLDGKFLEHATDLSDRLGLRIIDPASLVLEIDQLLREREYAPSRLSGSAVVERLVKEHDRKMLATYFQAADQGESRMQFNAKLRSYLAQPATYSVCCYEHPRDGVIALLVKSKHTNASISVPLFRVQKGRLSSTISRHILSKIASERSCDFECRFIITDQNLPSVVTDALQESRFHQMQEGYVRTAFPGVHQLIDITAKEQIPSETLSEETDIQRISPEVALNIEQSIWPGKLKDSPLPTFIVPIHPTYAMHLFDARLANADLIGAQAELALACENVYYRSNQACGLTAPARILWYVKKSNNFQGCMSIRACSLLSDLNIDTPKKLYGRYKRLGVYEWKNLADMVDDVNQNNIMAFLFSHTELFRNPIPWARFPGLGINSTLQSPLRISQTQFENIYKQGMNIE